MGNGAMDITHREFEASIKVQDGHTEQLKTHEGRMDTIEKEHVACMTSIKDDRKWIRVIIPLICVASPWLKEGIQVLIAKAVGL